MANVRDFRTRIRSVKSTQQITRAMKLVAASKLRRSQERILAARPYARKMVEVLSSLAARANPDHHPLLARTRRRRVLLVVLTADKGLCGSFNTNILNRARQVLEALLGRGEAAVAAAVLPPFEGAGTQAGEAAFAGQAGAAGGQPGASGQAARPESVRVDLVGKKGREWFKRRAYEVRRVLVDLFRNVTPAHAKEIATDLIRGFTEGEFDTVYLVYNEFKSVIQQRVVVEPLLPIPRGAFAGGAAGAPAAVQDYIYEPDEAKLLETLLPKHVEVQVFRALLESAAAEQGARMSAMDNATRNAGEMIDSLTLQMNKIRQASITKEILEVVSGAEALK